MRSGLEISQKILKRRRRMSLAFAWFAMLAASLVMTVAGVMAFRMQETLPVMWWPYVQVVAVLGSLVVGCAVFFLGRAIFGFQRVQP